MKIRLVLMSGIKFIGRTRDCVGPCRADERKRGGGGEGKERGKLPDPETGNEAADGKWHSATETKALLRPIKNLCITVFTQRQHRFLSPKSPRRPKNSTLVS